MNVAMFLGIWVIATILTGPFGLIGWPLIYWLGTKAPSQQEPK